MADTDAFFIRGTPAVLGHTAKEEVAIAAKRTLQAVLGGLVAEPGQLLHGVLECADAATDLDNALSTTLLSECDE
jgi:hypothetical protein